MAANLEIHRFTPTTEVFRGKEKIYNLEHMSRMQRLLASIGSDRIGGEPFRINLQNIGEMLGKAFSVVQTEKTQSSAPLRVVYPAPIIMGIPRGGRPLAEGVRKVYPSSAYLLTNAGDEQRPDEPLLKKTFPFQPPTTPILLVDTVIGSGETVKRHLRALDEIFPKAPIYLLSAIALLDYEGYGLSSIFADYPNLTVITGRLETEAIWKERKDGKKHLYVRGIGSVGDLVSVR